MYTNNLLLIICLVISTGLVSAQNTYQQLLPAASNDTTTNGTNYTWSLGDVFADDVTGSQAIIISRVEENLAQTYGLRLLGNPTAAITRLEMANPIPVSYQVYDLNGRLLISENVGRSIRHDVNLGELSPQIYLLSVFTTEGKHLLATFRVRKQ